MKRRLLLLVLVFTLLTLPTLVFAIEGDIKSESSEDIRKNSESEEILTLTLEGAIDYALKNSKDLKIQDINIAKAKLYRGRTVLESDMNVYEELDNLGVLKRTSNLNENIEEWNKKLTENRIRYDVEKVYYDSLQILKELEIAKEALELAEKQYEQSKAMYELGTISNQQLMSIELSVIQSKAGYDSAQIGYELQKMNFNNIIGLPLSKKVVLVDNIDFNYREEIKLEEAINSSFENNLSLKSLKENCELSELTLKAVKIRFPENTYRYREQQLIVEQTARNLDATKNGIEMEVRSAYYNLITTEKQIKTYEKAVEIAQNSYDLTVLGYELGQNTSNDVTKARIDLMDAKKNLSKQIHAYNLALLDFKYSTSLGKNAISGGI